MPLAEMFGYATDLRSLTPPAVLLITAYPSIDTAVRGMKLGARDYIGKPFSPDELRLVVRRALDEDELRRAERVASAMAVVLLIIVLLISWVQRRIVPDERGDLV